METISNSEGIEALRCLKSAEAPLYLSSSTELSQAARLASQFLFSSLSPHTPKSPFDNLLVKGFDAEQIWQQIDLQSQPLLSSFRRELKKLEKNPESISKLFGEVGRIDGKGVENEKEDSLAMETEDFEGSDSMEDEDMNDLDDDDEEEEEEEEDEDEGGKQGDEGLVEENEENEEEGGDGGIEDRFLKIKELEEYLEEDEAREYGTKRKKNDTKKSHNEDDDEENDDEDEEEEDEEEEEEGDEFGLLQDLEDDEEEEESARYQDFFLPQKKTQKRNSRLTSQLDGDDGVEKVSTFGNKKGVLSTHEKEQEKLRLKVEQMEKANLDPKNWNMMGEVSAPKRPKNSALEVDLDFEHNVRPAPVITEEVTASIEDLIKKRILEGLFDDVQKSLILPNRAPKELKGMDENKSTKGLAEVYEEEYVQATGLVSKASSITDELKKEASTLFKKLCLRLDALSHFHFTPKPVIEDMSIQTNVPALAIEEIAPLAVSDAAMLAPEEVFSGKGGDLKEEAELTQAERKRRRANKKRKFKAETILKMELKKARESLKPKKQNGEVSTTGNTEA